MRDENSIEYSNKDVFLYPPHRLMNSSEACEYLGIKKSYLYNLVNKGLLRPFKCGQKAKGNLRFVKSDLDRFLGRTQCQ